jgi:hypothetical protein
MEARSKVFKAGAWSAAKAGAAAMIENNMAADNFIYCLSSKTFSLTPIVYHNRGRERFDYGHAAYF